MMHAHQKSRLPLVVKSRGHQTITYQIYLKTCTRKIGRLPIGLLDVDRFPTKRVLSLVAHLAKGGSVPPIKVKKIYGGRYRVLDGRHRIQAAKLLGWSTILARWADEQRISADVL